MKNTKETTHTILQLGYQKVEVEELDDLSDNALLYQARIRITNLLNEVERGERVLCDRIRKLVAEHNHVSSKYGYTSIEIPSQN